MHTTTLSVTLLAAAATATFPNPKMKLNNGVIMPQISFGTWQYTGSTASDAVKLAFSLGMTHVDDAFDYNNQEAVGEALKGYPRDSFFITTKVPPCQEENCTESTMENIMTDFKQLGMEQIDMMLLHGSDGNKNGGCDAGACEKDLEQYMVMEKLYNQSKIKAIGVSNYCISCLKCLLPKVSVKPVVNQVQYHAGMGPNPGGLTQFCTDNGIILQAYSALGDGHLLDNPTLVAVGKAHNVSAPQIAYKWVIQQGHALSFKADKKAYVVEDLDLFGFNLTAADMAQLDKTFMPSRPSWSCTE